MQPRQRSKCSATVRSARPCRRARLHQPDPAARRVHLLVPERRRSGRSAGRSRSGRSRRSAPGPSDEHCLPGRTPRARARQAATRCGRCGSATYAMPTPGRASEARPATRAAGGRRHAPAALRASSQTDASCRALARAARPARRPPLRAPSKSSAMRSRRQEVDGARNELRAAGARARLARVGRSRRRPSPRPPGAGAAAARGARSGRGGPREPEKSLPRS